MKAPILLLAVSASVPFPCFAQGTVTFQNGQVTFQTVADRRVYCSPVGALVGTNYVAALYYLPGADQNITSPTQGTLAYGSNGLALAHFRPPTTTIPGIWSNPQEVGNSRTLVGVTEGQMATLQVRIWDSARFATFAEAAAADAYAWSTPFNYRVPASGSDASAYLMEGFRAFTCALEPFSPTLVLRKSSPGFLTLVWTPPIPGFILQQTTSFDALNWTDAPSGSTNPVVVPIQGDTGFFRLHKP